MNCMLLKDKLMRKTSEKLMISFMDDCISITQVVHGRVNNVISHKETLHQM